MYLISNIFITKAVDSISAYAHLGGDAAAHVSHAKDAAGVKVLNKLDIDGISLLGHTVVDWVGERWICQSMLPGIFSRRPDDIEVSDAEKAGTNDEASEEKKDDWVKVQNGSPTKSTDGNEAADKVDEAAKAEEGGENPLIVYGYDSEVTASIHWDAPTHKLMAKIASGTRLALHQVRDRHGKAFDFYASAEVKALCGNDGRRYLLDLPRLSPVDVEWLERDIDGKLIDSEASGPAYPHRLVLLRPELLETFWEDSLKRWARDKAAAQAKDAKTESDAAGDASKADGEAEKNVDQEKTDGPEDAPSAMDVAVSKQAEADAPIETTLDGASLSDFNLRFNPDAFADQPLPKGSSLTDTLYVPSTVTDEQDPSIKAVRDASLFLRQIAIPALVLDALAGNLSGVMDGSSLSKAMHARGINMRYLGYLVSTIDSFTKSASADRAQTSVLTYLRVSTMVILSYSANPTLESYRPRDGCSIRKARHPLAPDRPGAGACSVCSVTHPQLPPWHEPQYFP